MTIEPIGAITAVDPLQGVPQLAPVAQVDHRAAALNIAQHATAFIPVPLPYCPRAWQVSYRTNASGGGPKAAPAA